MRNLFSDFSSNLSTSYSPNSFQQKYPCNYQTNQQLESTSPNKPYEIIKNGELVGYFWYQGNSIDLIFDISGTITLLASDEYITVNDIANSLRFEATFYDFRGMNVLQFSNDPIAEHKLIVEVPNGVNNAKVTIQIDAEISAKLTKGVYKMTLVASHPCGYRETLFNNESAMFEVR